MSNLKTILIIGDVMQDEYVSGTVTRISPEAPIPIVKVSSRKSVLGGAANVAANVCSLEAKAVLLSVIGNDTAGEAISLLAKTKGIKFFPIASANRSTTVKTRIIGNERQVVRIDQEETVDIDSTDEERLCRAFEDVLPQTDIVVISDYGKGVCTRNVCRCIIDRAAEFGKRVIVDPKNPDWSAYSGAFLIKPNQKEFAEAANHPYNSQIALELSKKYGISNILTTRSNEGMSLVGSDSIVDIVAQAHEVFDVSGAGDTVIATMAVYLSSSETLVRSAEIANFAAGIAISKSGTYAVSKDELEESLQSSAHSKVVRDTGKYIKRLRDENKSIVFTNGCFDILHTGHIGLLRRAKNLGDILIIGLNSDASVKRLKGSSRPINNESERADVLSELECVDAIFIFEDDTPYKLVKEILPDIMVKGGDYTEEMIAGADVVKANGGKVVIIPLVEGKSTTELLRRSTQNDIDTGVLE